MRFDKLDLNLLVALDALISEQSVTNAARRLCLSQPAVTSSLNRLRDYFGDELMVLEGRQMRLTHRAEQLAAPVRQALELIRSEITQPGKFDPLTSNRRFVLIASDYVQIVLIADVMTTVAQHAPGVRFDIVNQSSDAQDRFDRAEADFMIVVKPFALKQHPVIPLFNDQHVLISWEKSHFGDVVTADEFFSAGHTAATFGRDRQPAVSELFLERYGHERRIEVRVPSFSALAQSVVGSNRLATMHRKLAEHFLPIYPIRMHEVPIPMAPIEELLQWHRLRNQDTGMQWLREQIIKHSLAKFGAA